MICPKHGTEMELIRTRSRGGGDLSRCPTCILEFNIRFRKATEKRARRPYNLIQRVLPPVIMSERWP